MTLLDFKQRIDKAAKYAGKTVKTCQVTVIVGKKEYELATVGQFGIVADVHLRVGKKLYEDS